ncbi:MAG: rod shape-determining protein [Alphaproteobacteria bacterium]|nr:rod shape-determining protein [Alphaproteobacteria bacterium]
MKKTIPQEKIDFLEDSIQNFFVNESTPLTDTSFPHNSNTHSYQKEQMHSKKTWLETFIARFSNTIAIDFGSTKTLAFLNGSECIMKETSTATINNDTKQIISIGNESKRMTGRTPLNLSVIEPIKRGVLADFSIAEQMLAHILRQANILSPKYIGPFVIASVPPAIRSIELQAYHDALISAGARNIACVHSGIAALIGLGVDIWAPHSYCVIDIGGGITSSVITSGGEILQQISIPKAGNDFNVLLQKSLRDKYAILIGSRTVEDLKIAVMQEHSQTKRFIVRGKSTETGLPLEIDMRAHEVQKLLYPLVKEIVRDIAQFINTAPAEVQADIQEQAVFLIGGGSHVAGIKKLLELTLHTEIVTVDHPSTIVAQGLTRILQDPERYKEYVSAPSTIS